MRAMNHSTNPSNNPSNRDPRRLSQPIGRPLSRRAAEGSGRTASPAQGEVRWDLVRRVRREIARGELETPEKWDLVLDRLLKDVLR